MTTKIPYNSAKNLTAEDIAILKESHNAKKIRELILKKRMDKINTILNALSKTSKYKNINNLNLLVYIDNLKASEITIFK